MENDYQKEIEELNARIEIEELKAKLSALERGETPKSKGSINFPSFDKDKIKGIFVSNKKLLIIISIITIFAVAILTTSICLIGIRGVYVNVNDPYDSYVFTATSYEARSDSSNENLYVEKGTWKKSGDTFTLTVKDEFLGKVSLDYKIVVGKGYNTLTINKKTYERISLLGWNSVVNKEVEIKFDLNGGTCDTAIENQKLQFLEEICYAVPKPTRQDATFKGWYTTIDGYRTEDSSMYVTNKPVYKDVTYYANWFLHSECPGHEYGSDCTCDHCGKVEHAQNINDDHMCDVCGDFIASCIDADDDYKCDVCGKESYIDFGMYPQSEVRDNDLIESLTASVGLPSSGNMGDWNSYSYFAEGYKRDYMWYIDKEYLGEKYRGVYFTSYRPNHIEYSEETIYSYQDENGYNKNTIYWFKYEPIKWKILKEENGQIYILSELILDSQEYNVNNSKKWQESTINKWLNDQFYNVAFNESQKVKIITQDGNNVSLLSEANAINETYGFPTTLGVDTTRQKKSTAYAQAQGAYFCSNNGFIGNGWWWINNFSESDNNSALVYCYGNIQHNYQVKDTDGGVVPALIIDLN